MIYIIILESPAKNFLIKLKKIFDNIKKYSFCKIKGPIKLPSCKKSFVIQKSPHIYKKSKEHFEKITSKIFFLICVSKKYNFLFCRFFTFFAWSYLGISVKKINIQKKITYLKNN